jgi:hypothetical protein
MGDVKKAELAFAKLEAQAESHGLQVTNGNTGPHSHVISGGLDGTFTLNAFHGPQAAQQNGQDTFDFNINGGHNFNLTIQNFNPALWVGGIPSVGQIFGDTFENHHDLLVLKFDPSSGVTNPAQIAAAETYSVHGHDLVLNIDAPNVHGQITLAGLIDDVPPGHTDDFVWLNQIGPQYEVG